MRVLRNDLAGMNDNLLSTSLPCANFAKIYPLSKMICHHSKNRLKIQKQCYYFGVSEKVPVLNNRSRALLAYHNHLSVGCWRAAASCEPQSKQRNQALSWTSGPVTNLTASNTKKRKILQKKRKHGLEIQCILNHPNKVQLTENIRSDEKKQDGPP